MNNDILNSIISASIGVLGAIAIKSFEFISPEKRKIRNGLIGRWKVQWYEYNSIDCKEEKLLVEDSFVIKKIRNNKFKVIVDDPRVQYEIIGNVYISTMTYEFHGIDDLGVHGTGVLSISLSRKRMSGLWIQSDNNDKNIIGRCIWNKC
jgi:DNA-directed RNA polymerase beta' subunit